MQLIMQRKRYLLITFSGFNKNNPLSKKSEINVWINSKIYNHVENIHQIYLLGITDLIAKLKYDYSKILFEILFFSISILIS